jgi:hypothetical protein
MLGFFFATLRVRCMPLMLPFHAVLAMLVGVFRVDQLMGEEVWTSWESEGKGSFWRKAGLGI